MTDVSAHEDETESFQTDVVIVGAGPAGLSAAIKLRQLAEQENRELSVLVLEKGSEVGAHILSGAVFDPSALTELLPDWRDAGAPVTTPVTADQFFYLGEAAEIRLPGFLMPPLMNNHGNYVISLGALTRWLGEQAEALGADIYPEQPAVKLLFDADGRIKGVMTGEKGVGRNGKRRGSYTPGLAIHAKYTLIAEGARGTLAEQLISHFKLDEGREPQKYGIGLKELWEVAPEQHRPGLVQHTLGWPLDNATGGGGFIYHFGDNLVSAGFVVHLNYQNPYLSPYQEFQNFKTHPRLRDTFSGGRRIGYGARALTEGGWQSVPRLDFPGGALLGCAAGFMNVPRLKGSHNAMRSGILAADAVFEALKKGEGWSLNTYESTWRAGPLGADLKPVRNVKPLWSKLGTLGGVIAGGADMWLNTLLPFLRHTFGHGKPDRLGLKPARECERPAYPAPDNKLTFDILSSVQLSNTNHAEDQPVHLKLFNPEVPIECNLPEFAEPAQFYCPAAVYEIVGDEQGALKFVINAQNCVHCKTCDIKDPWGNITWVPPEGGDGPNYGSM